ncbi:MAG: DUF4231 domain-containing protein [Gammaproteobacteria bacterium]
MVGAADGMDNPMPSDETLRYLRQRQATLSETANTRKRYVSITRTVCFVLGMLGSMCAAVAGGLTAGSGHLWLTTLATAAFLVSAYLLKALLTPNSIGQHVRARMGSEALKREAFLYATASGHYRDLSDDEAKRKRLGEAVNKINRIVADLSGIEVSKGPSASCPSGALSHEEYISKRVEGQIVYYRKAATDLDKPLRRFRFVELSLAVLAALLSAFAAIMGKHSGFDFAVLPAVLTTITGGIIAHVEASRYNELITSYRATANRLEAHKAMNAASSEFSEFVVQAEAIIETETQSWQVLWDQSGKRTN